MFTIKLVQAVEENDRHMPKQKSKYIWDHLVRRKKAKQLYGSQMHRFTSGGQP